MSASIAAAALLAAAATSGLAGCDTVRDATDAAGQATDKASICVDALRLAGA